MSCLSYNDPHVPEDLCNCLKESLAFCGVIWTFYLALISIFVERFCILLVSFLVFGLYNSCSFLYLIWICVSTATFYRYPLLEYTPLISLAQPKDTSRTRLFYTRTETMIEAKLGIIFKSR